MSKIDLNALKSGMKTVAELNDNFSKIEAALNDAVLYRDNPTGAPNEMENHLDMNSYRILNSPAPSGPNDLVRLIDLGPPTEFKSDIQYLSLGQTAVTFSDMDIETSLVYINGDNVDNSRLLVEEDFTIVGISSIELLESYPDSTIIYATTNTLLSDDSPGVYGIVAGIGAVVDETDVNYPVVGFDIPWGDGRYATLTSPWFVGVPLAPTAAQGTSTTQIATTKFVTESPAFSGEPTAPTAALNDNSTKLATTEFVTNQIATGTSIVVSSGSNADGWYRIWSDGYIEQWGVIPYTVRHATTIQSFPVPFTAMPTKMTSCIGGSTSGNTEIWTAAYPNDTAEWTLQIGYDVFDQVFWTAAGY